MKSTRRLFSLLLCLAMVMCTATVWAQEGTKLSPEPITYEIMVYEHASQPWMQDAVVLQEIFEKTNVQLKINVVPQSDYTTKLNVLLSTNQMPDIVKTVVGGYNDIKTYASSGIFLNLSDYMETYAPNYYALYQGDPNIQMYNFEGSTYGFCLYSDPSNVAQGASLVLRYDLLEKNNLPMPKTMDELLETMTKLKEIYPESQPWTSRGSTGSILNRTAFILGSGYGMYFEPETNSWQYGQITDTFPSVLEYLNKAYEAKVLDIDYATMNNQLWQEKMNTGQSFMYFENPGFSLGMTANLKASDPDALLTLAPVPENSNTGSARSYLYNVPEDAFYLISADIEHPEIAVALLDWCYSDEGAIVCGYGKEGETFYFDEEGKPQILPEFAAQFAKEDAPSYAVQSALGSGQLGFAPRYINSDFDASLNKALGIEEDPVSLAYYDLFRNDPAYVPGVIPPPFTEEENETIADILSPINTFLTTEYDKFIMGEVEVSQWAEVVEKLEAMDIQKVVDIYNEAYARALGQ